MDTTSSKTKLGRYEQWDQEAIVGGGLVVRRRQPQVATKVKAKNVERRG